MCQEEAKKDVIGRSREKGNEAKKAGEAEQEAGDGEEDAGLQGPAGATLGKCLAAGSACVEGDVPFPAPPPEAALTQDARRPLWRPQQVRENPWLPTTTPPGPLPCQGQEPVLPVSALPFPRPHPHPACRGLHPGSLLRAGQTHLDPALRDTGCDQRL